MKSRMASSLSRVARMVSVSPSAEAETPVTLSDARDYPRDRSPPRPSRKAVLNGAPGAGTVPIDFDDLIDNLEHCAVYFESDKTRPVFVRFNQSTWNWPNWTGCFL